MKEKQTGKEITFDDVKQIFVESVDEAETMADLVRIAFEKVYKKGIDDA